MLNSLTPLILLLVFMTVLNMFLSYLWWDNTVTLHGTNLEISRNKFLLIKESKKSQALKQVEDRLNRPMNSSILGQQFNTLRHRLNLQQLHYKIIPETGLEDTAYIRSKIALSFTNSTDQPIFRLLQYLLEDFPGLILVKQIQLRRDLNSSSPVIKGEFHFDWLKKNKG